MRYGLVGIALLCFLCGMLTPSLIHTTQIPSSTIAPERASPQDWVSESNIHVYSDKVVITIPNAKWATFANTNSMDPVLDQGNYGIQIVPTSPEQLKVGDIITYNYHGEHIIHRIVQIGQDANGYYFIVKGDNNPAPDPQPVRWSQVERVLVAVVY